MALQVRRGRGKSFLFFLFFVYIEACISNVYTHGFAGTSWKRKISPAKRALLPPSPPSSRKPLPSALKLLRQDKEKGAQAAAAGAVGVRGMVVVRRGARRSSKRRVCVDDNEKEWGRFLCCGSGGFDCRVLRVESYVASCVTADCVVGLVGVSVA